LKASFLQRPRAEWSKYSKCSQKYYQKDSRRILFHVSGEDKGYYSYYSIAVVVLEEDTLGNTVEEDTDFDIAVEDNVVLLDIVEIAAEDEDVDGIEGGRLFHHRNLDIEQDIGLDQYFGKDKEWVLRQYKDH